MREWYYIGRAISLLEREGQGGGPMTRGRNCEQVVDLNGEVCGRWVPAFATRCHSCGSVVSTRAERFRRGAAIAARMAGYFEDVNLCRSAHLARKRRAERKKAA